jgi:hypothetical protein
MQNRSLAGRTVVERLGTLLVVICALTLLIWVIDQGPRGVDSLMEWLILVSGTVGTAHLSWFYGQTDCSSWAWRCGSDWRAPSGDG